MTTMKQIQEYIRLQYLINPAFIEATLSPLHGLKDPTTTFDAVNIITKALTIFNLISNTKLNEKMERRHIAIVQRKTILHTR